MLELLWRHLWIARATVRERKREQKHTAEFNVSLIKLLMQYYKEEGEIKLYKTVRVLYLIYQTNIYFQRASVEISK